MVPLQLAPQSASVGRSVSLKRTVEMDGFRFDTFLADFSALPSVVEPASAASIRASEPAGESQGKRLREGLTLHRR